MPKEKFYPIDVSESDGDQFAITWHAGEGYTPVMLEMQIDGKKRQVDVDRSAINRAIRTLRRARDATYGADE